MSLQIQLLGPPQISCDGQLIDLPGYRPLALLAYLVVTGQAHSRDHLVDLLFDGPNDPRASLRYTLSKLRQAIGADCILADRQEVSFNFEIDYWLDVSAFAAGEFELFRGDFLEGLHVRDAFGFEDWAFFERERLRGVYQEALAQQLAKAQNESNDRTVIETAHTLLRLDNLREEWYRALMQSYARLGQREAAFAQYHVCRQVLAEEMEIEPAEETTALYERIQTGQPQVALGQITHNLPLQPTPFIGRVEKLAQITKSLEDPGCRLLTLTGPGGIGKTRLALQAASNVIESPTGQTKFSTGVYFVSLAPVSSPNSLVATIADALNFSFYSDANLQQQFLDYLREKELLLVLDNFEHLLAPSGKAIDLVTDILAIAPAVKILVTSREALNLHEEWLFAVDGMSFPTDDTTSSLEEASSIEEYSAVQLFVQCARRAQPGFSLATAEACVLRICRMIDGMPLGIELAAAWLKMFPCEDITRELERGLDFLTTSLKNIPARHHSMRAVFEHSWNLLSEKGQRILRQSSVFRGGFRQEAAEQVAEATFADLVALIGKSLLRRTPAGRYQMHELLRQFAAEKLELDPEENKTVQHRHSNYYLTFLQQREEALKGKNKQAILAEIEAEIENVRIGWQWAVAEKNVAEIGQALLSFWLSLETRGWFQEGEQIFGRTAANISQTDTMDESNRGRYLVLGKILAYQGWFCHRLNLHTRGREVSRESLAILRRLAAQGYPQARDAIIVPLNTLGHIKRIQGEYLEARELFEERLVICRKIDNPWETARTYIGLNIIACEQGEYTQAKQFLQKVLTNKKAISDAGLKGFALHNLGEVAYRSGDYEEARQLHQESLTIRKEIGDRFAIAWSLNGLGTVAYAVGQYPEAKRLCQESLTLFSEIGNQLGMMDSLNRMGYVTLALGQPQIAKDYFLKSIKIAAATQTPSMALDALMGMAMFLMEEGEKERAIELLALPQHHPASWQIFKDRAANLLAELEVELPSEVVSTALEQGKVRGLEMTVAELLAEFEA